MLDLYVLLAQAYCKKFAATLRYMALNHRHDMMEDGFLLFALDKWAHMSDLLVQVRFSFVLQASCCSWLVISLLERHALGLRRTLTAPCRCINIQHSPCRGIASCTCKHGEPHSWMHVFLQRITLLSSSVIAGEVITWLALSSPEPPMTASQGLWQISDQ